MSLETKEESLLETTIKAPFRIVGKTLEWIMEGTRNTIKEILNH